MMKRLLTLMMLAWIGTAGYAQEVEMADAMVENGMIYVVVGVLAIIFVGLVIYLAGLDSRIRNMEKAIEPQESISTGKVKVKANIELDLDQK